MPVGLGPLQDPVGTNMGNPHATFFVDDAAAIPLAELGPKLEHDRFFPERANIGVAQMLGEGRLRLRVWERGAGITLACGSGACAAVVAASRRGLVQRKADVVLEGGTLTIEWLRDDHVMMTGGIAARLQGRARPLAAFLRWPGERDTQARRGRSRKGSPEEGLVCRGGAPEEDSASETPEPADGRVETPKPRSRRAAAVALRRRPNAQIRRGRSRRREAEKKGWLSRLRAGLAKSTKRVTESITGLFTKKKLDQQTLDELEDALIQADLGVSVAARLVEKLGKERFGKEVTDEEVRAAFADDIAEILQPVATSLAHRSGAASRMSCW